MLVAVRFTPFGTAPGTFASTLASALASPSMSQRHHFLRVYKLDHFLAIAVEDAVHGDFFFFVHQAAALLLGLKQLRGKPLALSLFQIRADGFPECDRHSVSLVDSCTHSVGSVNMFAVPVWRSVTRDPPGLLDHAHVFLHLVLLLQARH